MKRCTIFVLFLLATGGSSPSLMAKDKAATITPGLYEDLRLAFDPDTQQVSGEFFTQNESGSFSCGFYFTGKLNGQTATIASYVLAPTKNGIAGQLEVVDSQTVKLTLTDEHGGCWNLRHFSDEKDPAIFTLTKAHPDWLALKTVKTAKAYVFVTADAQAPQKIYLITGDTVLVTGHAKDKLKIEHQGKTTTTTGWMLPSDFY